MDARCTMVALFNKTRLEVFPRAQGEQGLSLIEVIVVIALVGLIFVIAMPDFNIFPETEAAQKIGNLNGDIRSAYDMAVLHGKPHRLVFEFKTSDYWLEATDREDFLLGSLDQDRDPTPDEIKGQLEIFAEDFEEYAKLAGKEVEDSENEKVIKPTSPLLQAKDRLKPVKWRMVEDAEWNKRSLGPHFMIRSIQTEHHRRLQTFEELGEQGYVYLYFFPRGYVEKAVLHIAPADQEDKVQWDRLTYTVTTLPYEGIAETQSGFKEVDLTRDEASKNN